MRTERALDDELAATFPASDPPSNTPLTGAGTPAAVSRVPLTRRPHDPWFGLALSSEEHGPRKLVSLACEAERRGLDFLSISDHFHPWVPAQGHAPAVWPVLGGIASVTNRIVVGTGVTCPILRMHPAIVAQQAATAAAMFEGRFYLGLGTGEALNEAVTGLRWPSGAERLERLREAVEVIGQLWAGDEVNFDGRYYTVANARLYTLPSHTPPILIAAASPGAAELAGVLDGLITTAPDDAVTRAFEGAGGPGKPRVAQVTLCWGPDAEEARRTARKYWPTTGLSWETRSAVPAPTMFEDITRPVTEESVAEHILCGPDTGRIIDRVWSYLDAGFDHVYFHQVGPAQERFLDVCTAEIIPEVRKRLAAVRSG